MGPDAPTRSAAVLSKQLRYGNGCTIRRLAADIVSGDADLVDLLASTARSDDDVDLRARCLEVLGKALGDAATDVRQGVLASLFGPQRI